MTTMTRRRLLSLAIPASLMPAPSLPATGPQRPNMARLDYLSRQLVRLQEGWPDRAQETPEPLTPEALTARVNTLTVVDKIHSLILAELSNWMRWCVWSIGGQTFPPPRGEL